MTGEGGASEATQNTDRELFREDTGIAAGSYYENAVHVTAQGTIGMSVGGLVFVLPIAEWHRLAVAAHGPVTGQEATAGADGRLSEVLGAHMHLGVVSTPEGWFVMCDCGHVVRTLGEGTFTATPSHEDRAVHRTHVADAILASGFADEIRAAALREAAEVWASPGWLDMPNGKGTKVDAANYVYDWLRARADHTALGGRDRGEA